MTQPDSTLDALARQTRADAWVLYKSTEAIQRWFSDRRLPVLVDGTRFPDVALPAFDINYRAACQHAAGKFLSLGHRRLAMLIPLGEALGGDVASVEGFQAGCRHRDAVVQILYHEPDMPSVVRALDAAITARHRPTAFLVARATSVVTTLGFLHSRGLRVPQDVSVISRDQEGFLDYVYPEVSRYTFNYVVFASRISRLVLQMLQTRDLAPRQHWLLPELIEGQTLGRIVTPASAK